MPGVAVAVDAVADAVVDDVVADVVADGAAVALVAAHPRTGTRTSFQAVKKRVNNGVLTTHSSGPEFNETDTQSKQ